MKGQHLGEVGGEQQIPAQHPESVSLNGVLHFFERAPCTINGLFDYIIKGVWQGVQVFGHPLTHAAIHAKYQALNPGPGQNPGLVVQEMTIGQRQENLGIGGQDKPVKGG